MGRQRNKQTFDMFSFEIAPIAGPNDTGSAKSVDTAPTDPAFGSTETITHTRESVDKALH